MEHSHPHHLTHSIHSSSRQQLFHSSHLPPPSHLHLPPVNSNRSAPNTLPPLTSPYSHRHSSPPPSSSLPWPPTVHRTSNSRDDPPAHHHSQSYSRQPESRQMKREPLPPPPPAPPATQPQTKEADDNMPATCDFVKKLYKYPFLAPDLLHSLTLCPPGCSRISPLLKSFPGAQTATASSSRFAPTTPRSAPDFLPRCTGHE